MGQLSILLADDDRGALELYAKFFELAGWSYDLAVDGQSAIDATYKREYDVILTDLVMPGIDGFQLLRVIKARNPNQAVIVISGAASVDDVVRALREGASDILLKPIDFKALRSSVERIVLSLQTSAADDRASYQYLQSAHSHFEVPAVVIAAQKFRVGLVDRLAKAGAIDRNLQLRLELSVQEALTNSLEHGTLELQSCWKEEVDANGVDKFSRVRRERLNDPRYAQRKVRIHISFENMRLRIAIRDPGAGFLLKANAPDDRPSSPLRSYGRGLAIIAGTMDELRFQSDGSEIIMVKYLI